MRTVVLNLARASWLTYSMRRAVYRAMGVAIGRDALVAGGVTLGSRQLRIGSGGYIGFRCRFDNHAPVTLGDDVWVGEQTSFITMTHDIGPSSRRAGLFRSDPIVVGDGTWLGARVTVLPGVTIGKGVIVAAGAVVHHDLEDDHLYAGVPAVAKRRLGD